MTTHVCAIVAKMTFGTVIVLRNAASMLESSVQHQLMNGCGIRNYREEIARDVVWRSEREESGCGPQVIQGNEDLSRSLPFDCPSR